MKLEAKCLFPTSSSGANVFIHKLSESLEIRKILAHGIRMQTNPQTRALIFCIFTDFHRVSISDFHSGMEILAMATLTSKTSTTK